MKNREKYREEILKPNINFCDEFIKKEILNPLGVMCSDITCKQCHLICAMWLEEEYKEPKQEVDWSKVAVDTPVLVRDSKNDGWENRHFAKYENGKVFAWDDGKTSWTSADVDKVWWKYAKLEDVKAEEKK